MSHNDEEKIGFYTEEGVDCFTHMPKGLKNSRATLQRVMDKVLAEQKGRNVEVYLEEVVIKSNSEHDLVEDPPKENSQVKMSHNDEEKIGFHTEEGVDCFTHMPKGLKNSRAKPNICLVIP
nr:hypothetical protein [Tanacetum cinerariifolium]